MYVSDTDLITNITIGKRSHLNLNWLTKMHQKLETSITCLGWVASHWDRAQKHFVFMSPKKLALNGQWLEKVQRLVIIGFILCLNNGPQFFQLSLAQCKNCLLLGPRTFFRHARQFVSVLGSLFLTLYCMIHLSNRNCFNHYNTLLKLGF